MRMLVQRVSEALVETGGAVVGSIGRGLLAYLGIHKDDTAKDAEILARKLVNLRIFDDDAGRMNLSPLQLKLGLLVVSQFTLCADTRKGTRPNFMDAMPQEAAKPLYERFVELCRQSGLAVATGEFRAEMRVKSVNDGPVSIVVDSRADAPGWRRIAEPR
jgi:D-tyrosyl-tRNA(Tyr) deacylase